MKDKDQIQELFSKKLGNHEAKVNPELWNGIASQITTGATATAGISLVSKIIISVVSVAAISTAVVVFSADKQEKSIKTAQKTQKSIVLEEKEPVIENKSSVNLIEGVQKNSNTSSNVESQNIDANFIEENQLLNSTEDVIISDSDNQTGVLKEREDESTSSSNIELANNDNTSENLEETKTDETSNSTDFPLNSEKDQLVEGYSISKMPDIFTPNNDGQNDFIFIESNGLSDFTIVVMNDKSETVYKSTDVNFKWDGSDLYGNPVSSGNYVYFITAIDRNSNPVNEYQSLRIIR